MKKLLRVSILMIAALLALLPSIPSSLAGEGDPPPPIVAWESSEYRLVLRLTSHEPHYVNIQLADDNEYTFFYRDHPTGSLEPGKPSLPVLGDWILIPNGNSIEDVFIEIDEGEPTHVEHLNFPLAPVQHPTVDLEDAPIREFVKDEEVYNQNGLYPGYFFKPDPIEIQSWRGQDIARLELYPYQYNPAEQNLYFYMNLALTITFASDVQPIPHALQDEDFEKLYRNAADLNADEILTAEAEVDP